MQKHTVKELLTLPNLLTCFRFISAPMLLWLAWNGFGGAFLLLLAITFLSDVLDGMVARMLNQESELGALLDSWGDILIYATIAVAAWWLWPKIVQREQVYVVMTVISYLLPVTVGIIKFHNFTSYHTWTVKFAATAMGLSIFLLFLFDIAWPFRIAAFICLVASIEEIAITFYLSELRSNVRSLFHVMKRLPC
jgi:CDP-diacylglycerol--glycerol-3-phosphate 3-phosphatidyltransferase